MPILERLDSWPRLRHLTLPAPPDTTILALCRIQRLTIRLCSRLLPSDTIPSMPGLRHLSLTCEKGRDPLDRFTWNDVDLGRFPRLAWLRVGGHGPARFLDHVTGESATIEHCVIEGDLDFSQLTRTEAFFARFAAKLRALVITGGRFVRPIETAFPELESLQIEADCALENIEIPNCAKLVRLSISSTNHFCDLTWFIESLVPSYAGTLEALHLSVPYNGVSETVEPEAINVLCWCEHLKFCLFEGPIGMSDAGIRLFGKCHTELQAVMSCLPEAKTKSLKLIRNDLVDNPVPGLIVVPFIQRANAEVQVLMQAAEPCRWRSFFCACGFAQKGKLMHAMDPQHHFDHAVVTEDAFSHTCICERTAGVVGKVDEQVGSRVRKRKRSVVDNW